MSSDPFAPPKVESRAVPVLPLVLIAVAAVCLVGGCFTPIPAIGGLFAMLIGRSALMQTLAVAPSARSALWRPTLAAAMGVTALGALDFVGTILVRLVLR